MKKYIQLIFLALLMPSLSHAEEKGHPAAVINDSGVTSLSPKLRSLLSQEMRQLQKGMIEIHPLTISGKWSEIAPIAKKMEDSYVLKQNLSKQQMHELHSKLPDGFIELDQQFHYLSGMLEHAAKMEKPELVGFYFSKMSETCVSCHTKFAIHRFPAFKPKTQAHDH